MAYQIYDISGYSPDEYPLYFLDANVWIAVLKYNGSLGLKSHEQKYVDFFEAVIGYHSAPKQLQKKLKNVPKLVMTSLLLSEVVNAYMRKVAMVAYFTARGDSARDYDFKLHYRPIYDYQVRLRSIITDMQALSDYLVFVDDHFNELDPLAMLTELSANPNQYDWNDLYFGRLARLKGWALVSHDSDSLFDDILVITANENLIRAGRPRG